MAVTVTTVFDGPTTHIADIEATADADTTAVIPHTIVGIPQEIYLTGLLAAAAISLWRATGINGTNITLTKGVGVGSGAVGNQVRCITKLPHSATR